MPTRLDQLPFFEVTTVQQWRQWLIENATTSQGVWLVTYKKAAAQNSVTYDEVVEQALCFGWIDSKPKKVDDQRSALLITPRKPKSVWSKVNKERIDKLRANGTMTPLGEAAIAVAVANGSWTSIDNVEAMEMPEALRLVLAANPAAEAYFTQLSKSFQKAAFQTIATLKRPESQQKKGQDLCQAWAEGYNPLNWQEMQKRKAAGG